VMSAGARQGPGLEPMAVIPFQGGCLVLIPAIMWARGPVPGYAQGAQRAGMT